MKLLMFFNQAYDGLNTYDLSISNDIHNMIKSMVPNDIVVCTGPSQYTSCRRNISLALGWCHGRNINVYGFNILRHFIKYDRCFYVKDKLCWIKEMDEYRVCRVNELNDLTNYVGNIEINGSQKVDCSMEFVWNMINDLQYELKQEYCDKFNFM